MGQEREIVVLEAAIGMIMVDRIVLRLKSGELAEPGNRANIAIRVKRLKEDNEGCKVRLVRATVTEEREVQ